MNEKIQEFVGKTGTIWAGKFKVQVKIKDVKGNVYGRDLFLVTPVAGEGEAWVEKVTISKK